MKRKSLFYLFYFVCLTTAFCQTQTTRFSVGLNTGIPFIFGSIPSNISASGWLVVRYNLTLDLNAQMIKKVALQQCLKARNEIDRTTWVNVAK